VSVLSRLLPRGRFDDGVTVEPMRRRHLHEVLPIEQVSYPRPWSQTVFQGELDLCREGTRRYLVALRGHELVGYAGLMFVVDDAHVSNIAVHPEHRRAGIANRLLAELAWAAVDRGCAAMTLEVRHSNVAAQALYRRFGFVPAGVRLKYYENTDDAIVMWCHDVAEPSYIDRLRELCPEVGR
jgi:[ribosomal protein S18]-alanine N-acetyltransferase